MGKKEKLAEKFGVQGLLTWGDELLASLGRLL